MIHAARLGLATAAVALLGLPAAAAAKPTVSELRVEGPSTDLASGAKYVHDTSRIQTDERSRCNGSGDVVRVPGPTALGLIHHALRVDRDLRPLGVSDQFDFGLFVCGIGPHVQRGASGAEGYWLYKVNHKAPEVGADQYRARRGDEVLWYFQIPEGAPQGPRNTGAELFLRAPSRVRPRQRFTVTVIAYDANGRKSPAEGARVYAPGTVQLTDERGRATLSINYRGRPRLRARRGDDIASERTSVCVDDRAGRCPSRRGDRIYGTNRGELIRGFNGADRIYGRGGNDRIDARRGNRDTVICGRGRDLVRADRRDRISRTCERVIRR